MTEPNFGYPKLWDLCMKHGASIALYDDLVHYMKEKEEQNVL